MLVRVFEAAPISISHLPFSLSLSFRVEIAPISIGHSLSYQLEFGAAPISIGHLLISLSLSFRVGIAPISIDHFSCQFEFLGPHLY